MAAVLIVCLSLSTLHAADNALTNQMETARQVVTNLAQFTDIQKKILDRIIELYKETIFSAKPFRSLQFDEKRKQWEAYFGTDKPDDGYFVYINDENATSIDILLLPPVWTKYERKQTPNQPSDLTR